MKNEFNEKWLQEKVVISREELGNIVAREISMVLSAVDEVFGEEEEDSPSGMFKEILATFGAGVCSEIFRKGKRC